MRDALRDLAEHASEAMLAFDQEGRMLYLNPAAEALLHTRSAEAVGHTLNEINPEHHFEPFWAAFRAVQSSASPLTYRTQRWDRWFEGSMFPAHDRIGVVVRDVTEQVRHEEEQARLAQLRERLLGIVGHDLRSPLSAMLLVAEQLRRRPNLEEPDRAKLDRLIASAKRMDRMLGQLLDLTRIRLGGGIELSCESIDLADVLATVRDDVQVQDPSRPLVLQTDGDLNGVWDRERLYRVLTNLLGNAVQYGAPATPIRVCADGRDAEVVRVSVANEGTPIPREKLAGVFDPFRRAHAPGTTPVLIGAGLGLGLAITREIVHAHGGEIDVRSDVKRGTVFTVRLPREAPCG